MRIRDTTPADFAAILRLNEESVQFLSPLDAARLQRLHGASAYHRVVEMDDQVAAFLLVLREAADYDSPNYQWFLQRYKTFCYIDRIVVSPSQQGRRLGPLLYQDLFAHVAGDAPVIVTCEYDVEPPNPSSEAFHRRLGFGEVGRQRIAGGKKLVSLQALVLEAKTQEHAGGGPISPH